MKIEKINENQIRCFLSKQELDSRHLHLKELAYGTEKARALFQELMEEAFRQYGFIVENMPVMVEAVRCRTTVWSDHHQVENRRSLIRGFRISRRLSKAEGRTKEQRLFICSEPAS